MKNKLTLLACFLFFYSCDLKDLSSPDSVLGTKQIVVKSSIAKWHNDHTAAVVVTNDASCASDLEIPIIDYAYDLGITINYELVSNSFVSNQLSIDKIYSRVVAKNNSVYGHGHWHYNHDQLSYEESLNSFSLCYNFLDSIGLKTISYAYPGGNGYKESTRNALRDAGFLAGRMFDQLGHLNPYIVPDNETEPQNWYMLPTLVMQDYGYDACDICINNTLELIPFLDENLNRKSLIFLTYHAIGQPQSYGFYNFENFKNDLIEIKKRDFWTAKFDEAVLYIKERKSAEANIIWYTNENEIVDSISIQLNDNLPDDLYNFPLTIISILPQNWIDKNLILTKQSIPVQTYKFENEKLMLSILPDNKFYILKPKI